MFKALPWKTGHAAEQERDDVAAAREEWFASELDLNSEKLVFIDETNLSTNMARRVDRIDAPMTINGALGPEAQTRTPKCFCESYVGVVAIAGRRLGRLLHIARNWLRRRNSTSPSRGRFSVPIRAC